MEDTIVTIVALIIIIPTFLVIVGMIVGKGAEVGVEGIKRTAGIVKEPLQKTRDFIFKPNFFSEAWSFREFVQLHGPHVGLQSHINRKTQKIFHTLEIYNSEGKTYSVRFSLSLGELNAQQLNDRKDKLYVGKTNNGRYYLYDEYFKEWEDVDLS